MEGKIDVLPRSKNPRTKSCMTPGNTYQRAEEMLQTYTLSGTETIKTPRLINQT